MIYVTGDTHIPVDISKLNNKNFPEQKELSREDYVVILGDFGGIWQDGSATDEYWLNWLSNKPFTLLFIDGNHENFDLLNAYPVVDYMGGKAHKISDNIYHLMRGYVFNIDGQSIFVMGGGSSIDRYRRIEGLTWWAEEIPSVEELQRGVDNLKACGNKVDYILTHSTAESIVNQLFSTPLPDDLTRYFEKNILGEVEYKHWYFGHYHKDECIDGKHTAVYDKIILLNLNDRSEGEL